MRTDELEVNCKQRITDVSGRPVAVYNGVCCTQRPVGGASRGVADRGVDVRETVVPNAHAFEV